MSSDFIEHLVGLLDGRVDFSSHIALQTSNDFSFTHSLCGATTHIRLGTRIVTQPDHNDAIERRVGLAVTTAVETMTCNTRSLSRRTSLIRWAWTQATTSNS